eukprot:12416725-Karenia_brevis.AAC.1
MTRFSLPARHGIFFACQDSPVQVTLAEGRKHIFHETGVPSPMEAPNLLAICSKVLLATLALVLLALRRKLQGFAKLPCQAPDLLLAVRSFAQNLLGVDVFMTVITLWQQQIVNGLLGLGVQSRL